MTTTQTTEAPETLIVPAGGEFEVLIQVAGQYIHIAWASDRKSAERIASGVYAK